MRDQIRSIFNNAAKNRGEVREEFAKDVASVVKTYDQDGIVDDGTRGELIKVSLETLRGIDDLKKAYLHRKSLLNKILSQVSAQAAQEEKSGVKAHVQKMMQDIDDRMKKFMDDEKALQAEIDLIKKKQI